MKLVTRRIGWLALCAALAVGLPTSANAKGYSSGGHSYSSHSSGGSHSFSSSSHSFSSGSHSFSSGSSSHSSGFGGSSSHSSTFYSSGGGSKGFSSGSGKSYSAGSTWFDAGRHSYSSGKSYSSSSGSASWGNYGAAPSTPSPRSAPAATTPGSSSFTYDTAAAKARQEQTSKQNFTSYKEAQNPRPPPVTDPPRTGSGSYRASPPPLYTGGYYRTRTYIPDPWVFSTRSTRVYNVFNPYYHRPWVVYNDPYSSFFWWWLLDRSLDDRAWWAYHHRYDMDPVRYQALLATDQQLEARVAELESQQTARDPAYAPPGLDRDLMYSDQYLGRAYQNRPTALGTIAFWVLGIPTALGITVFFIWLIWFKRWQTAT